MSLLAAMTTHVHISVQSWEELWNQTNLGTIPALLLINYVIVNLNLNLPSNGANKNNWFPSFLLKIKGDNRCQVPCT